MPLRSPPCLLGEGDGRWEIPHTLSTRLTGLAVYHFDLADHHYNGPISERGHLQGSASFWEGVGQSGKDYLCYLVALRIGRLLCVGLRVISLAPFLAIRGQPWQACWIPGGCGGRGW